MCICKMPLCQKPTLPICIGTRISGFIVQTARPKRGDESGVILLAQDIHNAEKYVTWEARLDTVNELHIHSGHYFTDYDKALTDFCFRDMPTPRLEIDTPFGTLYAELDHNDAYPGIAVGIVKDDNFGNTDTQIALFEATSDMPEDNDKSLRLLVWGNEKDPDWTCSFTFEERYANTLKKGA